MKINKIITKINSKFINKKFNLIEPGSVVSIIYCDWNQEQIRIFEFSGLCVKLKLSNYNTTLVLRTFIKKNSVEQLFFLYSPQILDIKISKNF